MDSLVKLSLRKAIEFMTSKVAREDHWDKDHKDHHKIARKDHEDAAGNGGHCHEEDHAFHYASDLAPSKLSSNVHC